MDEDQRQAEVQRVRLVYEKRKMRPKDDRMNNFLANQYYTKEKMALLAMVLRRFFGPGFTSRRIMEIGAGSGTNLRHLFAMGFPWENIFANELCEDRCRYLRTHLPEVEFVAGDALALPYNEEFDVVFQSTVLTSILDEDFRKSLAAKMLAMTRPGGIVLSYDFCYNNPQNPDVRKLTRKHIRQLFPGCRITFHRVSLAPPIARRIGRLYDAANSLFPFLRTHLVAVIEKPSTL